MDLFGFIGNIFKPATDLIDNLHTSEAEKLELQNKFEIIKNEFAVKILEYEKQLMEAQAGIIKSEAEAASWMQRNWRPITMLTFLVLVVCDCFGFLKFRLAEEAWTLLQIGLGGYVIGRSAEKTLPQVVSAMKNKGK